MIIFIKIKIVPAALSQFALVAVLLRAVKKVENFFEPAFLTR